jgi:hypothetical protein
MVYSDTPALCSGKTMAQLFVSAESLVVMDVEGMKAKKQFINTHLRTTFIGVEPQKTD